MKDFEQHTYRLRSLGLRPTKQRLVISKVLFDQKNTFHFTIESLIRIIKKNFNIKISLATIYNTIHVFKKKGYLKKIAIDVPKGIVNEVLVVNDGSDDGSEDWLSNFVSNFSKDKFKFINLHKNKGKGYAIKKGLELLF